MLEDSYTLILLLFVVITLILFLFAISVLLPWKRMYREAVYYIAYSVVIVWFIVHRSKKAIKRWWRGINTPSRQLNKDEHLYDWES